MEAWREELYHGVISDLKNRISVSVGGTSAGASTTSSKSSQRGGWSWKNHKYIRVENGKYIYPEDLNKKSKKTSSLSDSLKERLKNANYSAVLKKKVTTTESSKKKSSSRKSSGGSKSSASAATENTPKIPTVDKGSVKSFDDLPKDPHVGDLYLITDLNRKVYWDGQMWVPEETNGIQSSISATTSNNSGSTASIGSKTDSKSAETVKKVETAINQTFSKPVSEVADTPQTKNGQNFINYIKSTVTTLANNVVSAIKNSKVYQAGVNLINKIRGK